MNTDGHGAREDTNFTNFHEFSSEPAKSLNVQPQVEVHVSRITSFYVLRFTFYERGVPGLAVSEGRLRAGAPELSEAVSADG